MYNCFKTKLNVVAWCLYTADSLKKNWKKIIQIDVMNSRTDPKHKFKTHGIILQNLEQVISIKIIITNE